MTNLHKFKCQQKRAIARGIDWCLTYEEWIQWWGTDIDRRGVGRGKLCMARNGDTGPYALNNIHKATWEQNTKEWSQSDRFKQLMESPEYRQRIQSAWTDPTRNTKLKQRCQKIHTPFGEFNSQTEAAKSLGVTQGTIWSRLKNNPAEYYRKEQQ